MAVTYGETVPLPDIAFTQCLYGPEDGSILPEDKVLWPNSFVLLHNLYPVLF